MIQNALKPAPISLEDQCVYTSNFDIRFLEPLWESPRSSYLFEFENNPHLINLSLCLQGKGILEINGQTYPIEAGSVWLSSREDTIFWRDYNRLHTFILRIPFVPKYTKGKSNNPLDTLLLDFLQQQNRSVGFDKTLCDYSDFLKKRTSSTCTYSFKNALLSLLFDSLTALNNTNTLLSDRDILINYIKANALEKITVHDLAELLSVSERSLFYIFSKEFNTTPVDFINHTRMNVAAENLKRGLSVREVSEMLKFSESTSFCRMFKKYYGVSPSKFCESPNQNADTALHA